MSFVQQTARALRDVLRAKGFDVVRYHEVPADLPPRVVETIRAVRPYTLTSVARLTALCEAVDYVVRHRIPGDIVECGVWKGGSMMAVARTLCELEDRDRQLYLFDTYEGMTQPSDKDVSAQGKRAADMLRAEDKQDPHSVWCAAPLDAVKQAMTSTGYDPAKLHFVKGRVEDTVPARAPERIAILRLDTDWYESTLHEMTHLFPRLVPGGVLIIDDYGHWQGARQAIDEYLRDNEIQILLHRIDDTGRSAIKR
jgi:O-methyltransferase